MGSWGALIMGFFGSLFAAMTLYWQWHVAGVALATPFLIFAAIALAAAVVIRLPGQGITASERGERAILWASIGEGVGLFLAVNIVLNLHRPEWLLPAMALVVGLHFLPIAWAAPFSPFYALGLALIAAAAIGGALAIAAVSGFAAAGALWIAAVTAVIRDRRAKTG